MANTTVRTTMLTRSAERREPGALGRKGIGLGMHVFHALAQLRYRLRRPWTGKLRGVDHLTLPCRDLDVAERSTWAFSART